MYSRAWGSWRGVLVWGCSVQFPVWHGIYGKVGYGMVVDGGAEHGIKSRR